MNLNQDLFKISSFANTLIHNSEVTDGLKREYKHFLGDVGDKNTIPFVIGAWRQLLNDKWFRNIKTVKFGQMEGLNTSKYQL